MPNSLEKIHKILLLEIQNKYANRAIIGGLEKFLPALRPELNNEGVSDEIKSKIETLFSSYSRSSFEEREALINDLLPLIGSIKPAQLPSYSDRPPISQNEKPAQYNEPRVTSSVPSVQSAKPNNGLSAPLHLLNKIGQSRASDFKNLGVNTIGELLYFFPRRYDDYSTLKTINRLENNDILTIIATVQSALVTKIRNREPIPR